MLAYGVGQSFPMRKDFFRWIRRSSKVLGGWNGERGGALEEKNWKWWSNGVGAIFCAEKSHCSFFRATSTQQGMWRCWKVARAVYWNQTPNWCMFLAKWCIITYVRFPTCARLCRDRQYTWNDLPTYAHTLPLSTRYTTWMSRSKYDFSFVRSYSTPIRPSPQFDSELLWIVHIL